MDGDAGGGGGGEMEGDAGGGGVGGYAGGKYVHIVQPRGMHQDETR